MDQYLTVATVASSASMRSRVAACAAQQGSTEPETWAYVNALIWAASPGWAAAWDSAVASGIPDPGADPAVITDGDVLATCQLLLTGPPDAT